MYKLIADIMFFISLLILLISFSKVESLANISYNKPLKDIPAKVAFFGTLTPIFYVILVSASFFLVTILLVELFNLIIPEGMSKLGLGLAPLTSGIVLYPQYSKLSNYMFAYLEKNDLLDHDSNDLHDDIENSI